MKKDDKQNSNCGGLSLLSTTCILFPRFNPYVDEIVEIMCDAPLLLTILESTLENCPFLDYYAASSGNFLPTFRDNHSVPS